MFGRQQYKDQNGKVPSDYLIDLLENGGRPSMALVTFVRANPIQFLLGLKLHTLNSPYIEIWDYSRGKYHLIYSHYPDRKEVCFLYLFESKDGNPQPAISEAERRLKNFYQIP